MAKPMSVTLSGVDGGLWGSVLGPKKVFEDFFFEDFIACNLTPTHLCMCDDSLGFEDCRLTTHLLNCFLVLHSLLKFGTCSAHYPRRMANCHGKCAAQSKVRKALSYTYRPPPVQPRGPFISRHVELILQMG